MTDYNTIRSISAALQNPAEGDHTFADELVQRFPYFVAPRYIAAAIEFKNRGLSGDILASMRPYMGNWLLFCDYVEGRTVAATTAAAIEALDVAPHGAEELLTVESDDGLEEIAGEVSEVLDVVETAEPAVTEQHIEEETTELVTDPEAESIADMTSALNEEFPEDPRAPHLEEEQLVTPIYTEDYFRYEGVKVSGEMPEDISDLQPHHQKEEPDAEEDAEKSLMVMMSFTEWLVHFRQTSEKARSEHEDKKAMRTMWQKEKLAAALEEENDEIPENVFEMAVNSITREEGLVSESLAEIYVKQQKYDKAVEMYRKLSLRNPQKNTYFARKIEEILKEKQL